MIDKNLYLDRDKHLTFGIFENSDKFVAAIARVRESGVKIIDCYSPFPIHGIEKAMGLKRSLLPVGAFMCGTLGFIAAFSMQYYMMAYDWKNIIGGKPYVAVSYMPVLFELTVLFTAFGIAILFFIRNKMIHGKIPVELVDMRQTDDRMVIAMSTDDKTINRADLAKMLVEGGAVQVRERVNHGYEEFTDTVVLEPTDAQIFKNSQEGHH